MLLGDAMGLMAGLLWGATTVLIRKTALSEAPAAKTLFYQMAVAAVLLLAYAAATGQAGFRYSAAAVLSVSFQAVAVALTSYLAWFWLLRRYLASRLSILSFMTPLFGVSFGVLILDEPLDAAFVLGALLVLGGILLVSGSALLRENCAAGRAEARPRGQPPLCLLRRGAPPRRPIPTPSAPRPPAPARNPTSPGRPAGRPSPWRPARHHRHRQRGQRSRGRADALAQHEPQPVRRRRARYEKSAPRDPDAPALRKRFARQQHAGQRTAPRSTIARP